MVNIQILPSPFLRGLVMINETEFMNWLWLDNGVGIAGYALACIENNTFGLPRSRRLFIKNGHRFSHHLARSNEEALLGLTSAFMTGMVSNKQSSEDRVNRIVSNAITFDEAKHKCMWAFYQWMKKQIQDERQAFAWSRAVTTGDDITLYEQEAIPTMSYGERQWKLREGGHLTDEQFEDWVLKQMATVFEEESGFLRKQKTVAWYEQLPKEIQKKYQVRAEGTYKGGRIKHYNIPIFGEKERWWTPSPSDFSKVKKRYEDRLYENLVHNYRILTGQELEDRKMTE